MNDPIRGKTLRFTFDEGPMAGKTFEHHFIGDGTVAFHMVGGERKAPERAPAAPFPKYEIAVVRDDVCAVSYLSSAGYTLTTILDFARKKLVAFSSDEKTLGLQHGSFEEVAADTTTMPMRAPDHAHARAERH